MDDSPVPPPSHGVPLLTATLGNSGSFSVVLWCGGDVLDYCSFPWIDGSDPQGSRTDTEARGDRLWTTEECIKKLVELTARLSSPCDVVLSGVVPAKLVLLEGMFKSVQAVRKLWRFHKQLPDKALLLCPLDIKPVPSQSVGEDRLAACLGALALSPDAAWVVVDCGTALTLNVVNPIDRNTALRHSTSALLGTFEGGLILPGERLMLNSLFTGTAQLPHLDHWASPSTQGDEEKQDISGQGLQQQQDPPLVGLSTQEAVRAGVRWMQIFGATDIALSQAEMLASRGQQTSCVLTGGGAAALWPHFKERLGAYSPRKDPLLAHRGLLAAYCHHHGLPLSFAPQEKEGT